MLFEKKSSSTSGLKFNALAVGTLGMAATLFSMGCDNEAVKDKARDSPITLNAGNSLSRADLDQLRREVLNENLTSEQLTPERYQTTSTSYSLPLSKGKLRFSVTNTQVDDHFDYHMDDNQIYVIDKSDEPGIFEKLESLRKQRIEKIKKNFQELVENIEDYMPKFNFPLESNFNLDGLSLVYGNSFEGYCQFTLSSTEDTERYSAILSLHNTFPSVGQMVDAVPLDSDLTDRLVEIVREQAALIAKHKNFYKGINVASLASGTLEQSQEHDNEIVFKRDEYTLTLSYFPKLEGKLDQPPYQAAVEIKGRAGEKIIYNGGKAVRLYIAAQLILNRELE